CCTRICRRIKLARFGLVAWRCGPTRGGNSVRRRVAQYISRPAARMDQWLGWGRVDFAPQSIYIYLDGIGEWIEGFVPDMFGNLFTPDHAARMARQIFEQRVLFCCERNLPSAARRCLRRDIQNQVLDGNPVRPQFAGTPQE